MGAKRTWLVTGSSRGIGFEFVRQLLLCPENIVFATCRTPDTANGLQKLAAEADASPCKRGRIQIVEMDITDEQGVRNAAAEVGAILGDKQGLDFLVNNAAITLETPGLNDTIITAEATNFLKTMTSNAFGVMLVLRSFAAMLDAAEKPVVVNISSTTGSISSKYPYAISYCMSKAALNMLTAKFAVEKPNVITISMCPGWVKTDSGGPNAPLSPQESVSGMLEVMNTLAPEDSGTFRRYNKEVVPW